MAKPRYTKPTDQLDREARLKDGFEDPGVLKKGEYPGPSDNGFVNVDPVYQNFANDTEKPFAAEDGVQKKIEEGAASGESLYTDDVNFDAGKAEQGETTDYEGDDEETTSGTPTGSPSTPSSPAQSTPNNPPTPQSQGS